MRDQQLIPRLNVKVPRLKLERMFKQQQKFQKRFYNIKKMNIKQRQLYIQLMLHCIVVESVEALNWLNWKPWKKQQVKFDRYEFLNELIDIQHFLINAALAEGCTAAEFSKLFFNKGKENINRQERRY